MANTQNFNLATFPADDADTSFLNFRTGLAGDSNSNMTKIDEALLTLWRNAVIFLTVNTVSESVFRCSNTHAKTPIANHVYLLAPTETVQDAYISIEDGDTFPIRKYDGSSYQPMEVQVGVPLLLTFDGARYVVSAGKDGAVGANGQDGNDGVGIVSVMQTETSLDDGGVNLITGTLSSGETFTFEVRNGSKGSQGENGSDATVTQEAVAEVLSGATLIGGLSANNAHNSANPTSPLMRNIVFYSGVDISEISVPDGTLVLIEEE